MTRLYETHRPRTLGEVIGQDKAVTKIERIIRAGALGGNAFLLTGKSGTGKTTIARIMAGHIAEEINVTELDAVDCTLQALRDMEYDWCMPGMGAKNGRAYIINEVHTMTAQGVGKWLTALERIPEHALVVFTTTNDGISAFEDGKMDAAPFLSRCVRVPLASQGIAKDFALHVMAIAEAAGMGGLPLAKFERLAKDCKCNMRSMIQAVYFGEMLPA